MAEEKQLLNEAELENITGGGSVQFKCTSCKKEFYAGNARVTVCSSCGGLSLLIDTYNYIYPNG